MSPSCISSPCDVGGADRQAKINSIKQDFLDRDGVRFVKVCHKGRLDWESTIPEGHAYSEFVMKISDKEELMRAAYGMASDMVKVMDTKEKINVSITNAKTETDGKTVRVATNFFDSEMLGNGQKMDVFVGMTIHECCHVLWTDFNKTAGLKGVVHTLENMIEDERIERLCCDEKPGLSNFLAATKDYFYNKVDATVPKVNGERQVMAELINAVLAYVRFPKALCDEAIEEFYDVLYGTREILTPYPASTEESVEAARKILELIKQFLKNYQNNNSSRNREKSSDGEDSQEDNDSSGQQDSKNENGDSSENEEQQESKGGGNDSSADGQQRGSKNDGNGSSEDDKEQESDKDSSSQMSDEQLEESLDDLVKTCGLDRLSYSSANGELKENQMSEVIRMAASRSKYIEGRCEKGTINGTYIEKGRPDKDKYLNSLSRVRPYISAVRRALTCSAQRYEDSLRGCRTGKLDTSKLAEAFQGAQNVHVRKCEVRADNVAVAILVDESGSMWGDGEDSARDAAVLLNEALEGIPGVDLYIYGHTANATNVYMYAYREHGKGIKYALGGTDSRSGNRDSVAIREVASRVRKFTKDRCLLFVLSDGAPNEDVKIVHQAVKDVEKDGFPVLAISIDPYYDPSTMYDHNITLSDLPTLAKELGKTVKHALMTNMKREINVI